MFLGSIFLPLAEKHHLSNSLVVNSVIDFFLTRMTRCMQLLIFLVECKKGFKGLILCIIQVKFPKCINNSRINWNCGNRRIKFCAEKNKVILEFFDASRIFLKYFPQPWETLKLKIFWLFEFYSGNNRSLLYQLEPFELDIFHL